MSEIKVEYEALELASQTAESAKTKLKEEIDELRTITLETVDEEIFAGPICEEFKRGFNKTSDESKAQIELLQNTKQSLDYIYNNYKEADLKTISKDSEKIVNSMKTVNFMSDNNLEVLNQNSK